jgi:P-type E1-E2 ATPase
MFFVSITLNLILESNTPIYIIFINILIIICPYSLLIVDSIKKILITNNLLKKKIILKNVNAIEKINSIDTVVLDKTGVLTNGKFCVSKINNHSNMTDKELLSILGSIEKNSTHPIARGITSYLKDEKIKTNNDFLTEDLSGLGVKAKDDKDIYYACSSLLLKKLDIINSYQEEERKMLIDGNSVIYLVKNNKVIATFGIKDTLRKESINFVNSLKKKKLDIYILTGDNEVITNKIAQELNITNIYSGTTQEEKNNFVNKLLKENKKVLMIGDGENDILALNSATIGVTLKGVTDSVISASDIVLTSRNLLKILDLFTMGNKVSLFLKRAIYIYLIVSLFFIPVALELVPNVNLDFFLIIVYIILNIILLIINTIYIKKAK